MFRTAALGTKLVLFALTGCMSTGQGPTTAYVSPESQQPVPVGDAAVSGGGGASVSAPQSGAYRLGPLDVIEISVFEVPELTKTLQVDAGGMISLPLIGPVAAGGRTIGDIEREIAQRLEKDYLQSPQVSVFVKDYTSQRITVEGAVNSPGVFPISGRMTLLQAIAMAKGPDRTADESGVIVFRTGAVSMTGAQSKTAAVFDLEPIRSGASPDPVLMAGDVIVVDQSAARTAWRDLRESIGVLGFFRPTIF